MKNVCPISTRQWLYVNLNLPDVSKDAEAEQAEKRGLKEQFRDFAVYFSEWRHAKVLFATLASWFLL